MAPVVASGRVDGEEVEGSSTGVVPRSLDSVVVSGVDMVVVSVNGPVVSGADVVVKTAMLPVVGEPVGLCTMTNWFETADLNS